ncbi:MAG: ABC transporter ATP-binding protein/permease [Lachnospiraceae bacterium]|nr:ABC transporter ATP-binding protein/permease [Lachnospiraceae bacterium]
MRKKEKAAGKNPLHREYGLWSNLRFVTGAMFRYEPKLKFIIVINVISCTVVTYLWSFISKFVIDAITQESTTMKLFAVIAVLFAVQVISTVLQTYAGSENWYRYINTRFNLIVGKNRKFMTQRYKNLEDKDAMDCYQKAGNSVGGNREGVEGMMRQLESTLIAVAAVIVGLCIIGTLSIPVVAGMTLIAVLNFVAKNHTNRTCKRKIWDPLATWFRKDNYMNRTFTDFSSAKDIRMYDLKDFFLNKYRELGKERLAAQKENELRWWICEQIGNLLWLAAETGLYVWLIYSVLNKDLSIGNFTLYLGSAATFFSYMLRLLDKANELLQCSRQVDDFRSFMDIDSGLSNDGAHVPAFENYEFTFEDVWFKYPGAEKYAIKNLNLTVKAGQKLAVVGLNGAGKSTFIKLLLRLYEPTKGRILLNGTDIAGYDIKEYYNLFSPVFQDICLFAFPLYMNVSMKEKAVSDRTRAEKCLEEAGMKQKVAELKNGIDTEVLKVLDDEGVDFSGGERQKIAFARALYKNAPVIVLDEPTAALDALAEARLYREFDRLTSGRTAIYISHRLSSTQFCNNVAMFKDAELVEYGTHESLLKAGGAYSEMFRVQAQYYTDKGINMSEVVEG